ncbi:sigma-54-dependent Fis family transcriptional regulator, partial [bacterium]|nr:sigma-54-dependent Fis family transcriptional regulator [bacterium]
MPRARVLVADDEPNMRTTLAPILKAAGFDSVLADSAAAALARLEEESFQVLLTDARMPGMDGYQLLTEVRQRYPRLPVVMITAYATPKLAVQAIRNGAADYLSKPFDPEELVHVLRRVLQGNLLQEENRQLKGLLGRQYRVEDLIGECPAMREIHQLLQVTAPTDATVLLLGESGTGKEM